MWDASGTTAGDEEEIALPPVVEVMDAPKESLTLLDDGARLCSTRRKSNPYELAIV